MPAYTMTGPTTGLQQVASTNFTVTADATAITTPVVVTPNDGGKGGTFNPASVSLTAANQAKTFTYTPKATGAATIKATNNLGYTNPANLTYTATLNKDVVINQILFAQYKNRGYNFPFDEIVRDGGVSNADALALKSAFETYYKLNNGLPAREVRLPDKAAAIHKTTTFGRVGRGGGDVNADKGGVIRKTTQNGRSDNGASYGDTSIDKTVSTGR